MTTLPQPKYYIGARVWTAEIGGKRVALDCPDCKGTRVWTATSATGEQFQIDCPRCTSTTRLFSGHNGQSMPDLYRRVVTASAISLTIGSVRIDTARTPQVEYMCVETGVGSGRIYHEANLFATEEEAQTVAVAMAAEGQAELDRSPNQMLAADFAGRTLQAALKRASQQDNWHAWDTARHYQHAIERLMERDDLSSELKEDLEELLSLDNRSWVTPHPIEKLLPLIRQVLDMAEGQEIFPDALVFGIDKALAAMDAQEAQGHEDSR